MIEDNLFQVLTLALLFLMLIALLAALATLSGIKKSLSEGPRAAPPEPGYTPPASTYGEAPSAYTGSYSSAYGGEPAATPEPAPQEVATGYVPLSQATEPEPEPVAQPAAATPASVATDPEEQPFERDGRWWFKRGNELLVYDEGTGQWVAAGEQPAATPAAAPVATATDTGSFPVSTGEAGEGWRCSSCGAINGSTATVCRMCFTPR
ncbi:MAG: hypothetical protein ACRDI3_04145 [Actinomycetota bacterium]